MTIELCYGALRQRSCQNNLTADLLSTYYLSKGDLMHIKDLIARTGVSERQVRYLIAEGFVPPPRGGRATADYGDDHVAAVQRYMRLREVGFPPAAIKLLLQAREGAPFPVAPGVTLVVDPEVLATAPPIEPLVDRIRKILIELFKEPKHARHRAAKYD